MPASERVPAVGLSATDGPLLTLLTEGELTVRGQVRDASNAVLYCEVAYDGRSTACVYKPVAGERPLWDFPDGTLAQREVAAYVVSEATGWGLVPPTALRDGPYGQGMVQLWIDGDEDGAQDGPDGAGALLALVEDTEPAAGWKAVVEAEVEDGRTALLVHADDVRLRRLAVLDAVINNADRKGGHLLPAPAGRLYGIDHGVTFHREDKLRTVLWGWAREPLDPEDAAGLRSLLEQLGTATSELVAALTELLAGDELAATVARCELLLRRDVMPMPSGGRPSIPWPAF
jgi:uncharacterized repeat protein (TIGR03843 family)